MENKQSSPSFEIENTYHWPVDGESRPWTEFWVTTFTKPVGKVSQVEINFSSDDGKTWSQQNMNKSCVSGEQDVWHAHLGTFPARTVVHYALKATGQSGGERWDNCTGQNYQARIGSQKDIME